jgi:hypothetical protein
MLVLLKGMQRRWTHIFAYWSNEISVSFFLVKPKCGIGKLEGVKDKQEYAAQHVDQSLYS